MLLAHHPDRSLRLTALAQLSSWARLALAAVALGLAACGGGGGAPPPPPGGAPAVAPSITTPPAALVVTEGQAASFAVTAAGTAPLTYQWQRNGADIAGATGASYTIAASTLADNGVLFRVVVGNSAGSVTSSDAALGVTPLAPVLSVTLQPANTSVVAGSSAAFTVAATCSSGTLGVQWQRAPAGAAAFVAIAGATGTTLSLATAIADNGAQVRALLDCSGASNTTSSAALLTVTAPATTMLAELPITGLRAQAEIRLTTGIDADPAGSYTFISFNRVKRLSADLTTITPVAGGIPSGAADGPPDTASFNQPRGLTQDLSGNIYLADTGNHTIRKIAVDGSVSTIAGLAGSSGYVDANGSAARFNSPYAIALGPDGDLYVCDSANNRIRRVTVAGAVSTYAGDGNFGFNEGAPLSARFAFPRGVAVAASGEVFVADYANQRVRRIGRSGSAAGSVSTLAGNGMVTAGSPDGIGTLASIAFPSAMVLRGTTLTVRDELDLLRQIDTTTGVVTTLTGRRGVPQDIVDGPVATAQLHNSAGITAAPGGGFIISESISLRTVSAAGTVLTIAATDDLTGVTSSPTGVGTLTQVPLTLGTDLRQSFALDPAGNLVVADNGTRMVRRIAPSGAVTPVAGLPGQRYPVLDGQGSGAHFLNIGPIAIDPAGVMYLTDNYSIRRIATDNTVTTLVGSRSDFSIVDGNAATARFSNVFGMTRGLGGDLVVSDGNTTLRRVDMAGNVTTIAGVAYQSGDIDGPVATARISPRAVAYGPDGSIYFGDGSTVKRLSADGTTISRTTVADYSGALSVGADGTLYYFSLAGLKSLTPAGVSTVLIPAGPTTLGADPHLLFVISILVAGPKQLVLLSQGQLYKVSLP
jgi:streptogramin lyase